MTGGGLSGAWYELLLFRRIDGEMAEYWEVEVYVQGEYRGSGTAPTMEEAWDIGADIVHPPLSVIEAKP